MELLRLVAMMMILVMHMDYGAFGLPTAESVENAPMTTFGRIFVEHLCLVAVNVYVLISGWFGIRPKMKSFVRLMLQVAMYSIIITLIEFVAMFLQGNQCTVATADGAIQMVPHLIHVVRSRCSQCGPHFEWVVVGVGGT